MKTALGRALGELRQISLAYARHGMGAPLAGGADAVRGRL